MQKKKEGEGQKERERVFKEVMSLVCVMRWVGLWVGVK